MSVLKSPLRLALGTTSTYIDLLAQLNIHTVEDLLLYYPRTHEDQSQLKQLHEVIVDQPATLQGKITDVEKKKTRNNKILIKAIFTDESGNIAELVWFNQRYLLNSLPQNIPVIVSGRVRYDYGRLSIQSPVVEVIRQEQLHTGRIVPVYREHDRITSKWLREKMAKIIHYSAMLNETLPLKILESEKLLPRPEAIRNVHFPESEELLTQAKERLAFEELFLIRQEVLKRKRKWQEVNPDQIKAIPMEVDFIKAFFEILPFEFTQAQKISLYEILKDMEREYPMSRLMEGDVGSGKTVVVVAAMLNAFKAGYQSMIMAPTEVLANQHYATISKLVEQFCNHERYSELMDGKVSSSQESALDLFSSFLNKKIPQVAILTGSVKGKRRQEVLAGLENGEIDIVVGTHALIQDHVKIQNLGLAIVDEQHRFGVEQREKLKDFGAPHFLNMTATPIPRSLALTAYGDHDLSVIDEMPKGRKEIITKVVPERDRPQVYQFIADQINKGRQVYVICPLIDESDTLEVKSVIKEQDFLRTSIFPQFKIGLMHGKLSPGEKDYVMKEFKEKRFDILVSTSVIEVGIDVPNSTIMMIEGAERFGLSQLHQFRGRVGRGEHQSYCFLFTESKNQETLKRLKCMEKYSNGFKLAEIDLQLRGPGEVYGLRQSGVPDLKMASLGDTALVMRVKKAAEEVGETFEEWVDKVKNQKIGE